MPFHRTPVVTADLLRSPAESRVASLGFRTDLALAAAEGAIVERRRGFRVIRSPRHPTFHWGNFLLLDAPPEPGALRAWIDVFDAEFPGAGHLAIGVDGTDGAAGDEGELVAEGLALERSTVLAARELVPPPHGVAEGELRALAVDSDEDWAAALALKRDNNADIPAQDFAPFAARELELKRELQAAGNGAWFGAFADGRMVSGLGVFALGRAEVPGDRVARFQSVDTLPGYRGRGFAGSLVHLAGAYALGELQASTLVIVADPAYHAIGLYRSLGFEDVETQVQLSR